MTTRRKNAWPEDHLQCIRDHYATKGPAWCAEQVGRPRKRVINQASKMGILFRGDTAIAVRGGKEYVIKIKREGAALPAPKPKQVPKLDADYSKAVVTIYKTPEPRFHVPDSFVGMFSRVGVGRDLMTGRPWFASMPS